MILETVSWCFRSSVTMTPRSLAEGGVFEEFAVDEDLGFGGEAGGEKTEKFVFPALGTRF